MNFDQVYEDITEKHCPDLEDDVLLAKIETLGWEHTTDTLLDENGYQDASTTIHAFYSDGRGAVVTNAYTVWTDASSLDDVIRRYRNDDMQN